MIEIKRATVPQSFVTFLKKCPNIAKNNYLALSTMRKNYKKHLWSLKCKDLEQHMLQIKENNAKRSFSRQKPQKKSLGKLHKVQHSKFLMKKPLSTKTSLYNITQKIRMSSLSFLIIICFIFFWSYICCLFNFFFLHFLH